MEDNLLPPVTSPNLVLTHPTEAERLRIWHTTHSEWGTALTPDDYVARERHLLATTFGSEDDGNAAWILTVATTAATNEARPILATCETWRKPALLRTDDGELSKVTAYGIGSVYTFAECRRRGYAAKMMEMLGEELKEKKKAAFSILYSDIGKRFYANLGWKPFESAHLEFSASSTKPPGDPCLRLIRDDGQAPSPTTTTISHLAKDTDTVLGLKVSSVAASKTPLALIPTVYNLRWHFAREAFVCNALFAKFPEFHGAVYEPDSVPNSRVWVTWTRCFYAGASQPEKNVLHILHFVNENEGIDDEVLTRALRNLIIAAKWQASQWHCARVDWWNPSERVQKLVQDIDELGSKYVVRENEGITSLQWFGQDQNKELEWVANEYFAWC